ncbi:prephenate dehydratase [Marivirga sp. S37H4]|uniref:prephenate dehydratase n=1 Tax=Marivirga aurantiaca TaxID=2802615 RepID=A0A934WYR4_9BACT|nr:prephenate dehydratase [Marivirga aurantiaca]MBK6265474.1 prephenate dehydratase [Marivirga aurantiaca]
MQKIAIQGVRGAFHEAAAKKYAGESIQLVECMTFRDLCKSLKSGQSDMAVMAIENTIAGSLSQNYGLINEYQLSIVGEVYLRIQMQLLALPGVELSAIKFIYSHPVALNQCNFFLDGLSGVQVYESKDTAESARMIREGNLTDTAAIAGETAAQLYSLDILKGNIETNKENYTRFLVLTNQSNQSVEGDKASISFELGHQPGTLADILTVFKKNRINLTNIQSMPLVGKPYEYRFHADLTWESKVDFEKAMESAGEFANSIILLGIYKRSNFNFQ